MASDLAFLVILVYGIMETLEKFGVNRKVAHLIAIPLGLLGSFAFLKCNSIKECILKGLVVGITSVGICDSSCNLIDLTKKIIKRD